MTAAKRFKRPPLRHRRRHHIRQLFNNWPWLVWLGAAIMVLVMLPGGLYRVRFHAQAERVYQEISPSADGRLISLEVEMGDMVEAGQIVGQLDNTLQQRDLMMDQVKLLEMQDEIKSTSIKLTETLKEQKEVEGELLVLEARWQRSQQLREQGLVLEQEIEDLRPQISNLKEQLEAYPNLIRQREERLNNLQSGAEFLTLERRTAVDTKQRALIAEKSGIVEEVMHYPGDFVKDGDTVVRVIPPSTRRVIAFMPEAKRMDLAIGERCRVITETADRKVYHGTVLSITAGIRKLPVNTGFSDQLLRGRRIVIELEDGELLPGEQVVVVPDISIFEQWFGKR